MRGGVQAGRNTEVTVCTHPRRGPLGQSWPICTHVSPLSLIVSSLFRFEPLHPPCSTQTYLSGNVQKKDPGRLGGGVGGWAWEPGHHPCSLAPAEQVKCTHFSPAQLSSVARQCGLEPALCSWPSSYWLYNHGQVN